mgnify:CR=1 FL=1
MLGITKAGFSGLSTRRNWKYRKVGKVNFYTRSDLEAEIAARSEPANSRVPPAVVAHTKKCADRVRAYWAARGHCVDVEAVGGEIVSDLVNGLPRQ